MIERESRIAQEVPSEERERENNTEGEKEIL